MAQIYSEMNNMHDASMENHNYGRWSGYVEIENRIIHSIFVHYYRGSVQDITW